MQRREMLYHYTSAEGLLGMLGTPQTKSCIWMTQIQYMNDSDEWFNAYKMAIDRLTKLRDHTHKLVSRFAKQMCEERWRHEELTKGRFGLHRAFVFSLSANEDQLSQWRGYAPHGGYSLGFGWDDLQTLGSLPGFSFHQCVYDDKTKEAHFDEALRGYFGLEQAPDDSDDETAKRYIERARGFFETNVMRWATYFKNGSFHEEEEYRLVATMSVGDDRSGWRTRGNLMLPFCRIDTSADGITHTPVRRVVIGPGVNRLLAEKAIEMCTFRRTPKVAVDYSKCSFRH